MRYEPKDDGSGFAVAIPENCTEDAAVDYIRMHVPVFAAAAEPTIAGFLAGAKYGAERREVEVRHESHDDAFRDGCVLCEVERESNAAVSTFDDCREAGDRNADVTGH